jgi:hypothetical protein
MTPFLCHFPESGKYKHTKMPMPWNQHYVSLSGFLKDIKYNNGIKAEGVALFVLDVENIVFCE